MPYEPNRKIWTSFIKRNADKDIPSDFMQEREEQVRAYLENSNGELKLFLLNEDNVSGPDKLDFIEKLGPAADAAYKAKICSAFSERTRTYWLSDGYKFVTAYGTIDSPKTFDWHVSGLRPAARFSKIKSMYPDISSRIQQDTNGILSFYFGHDCTDPVDANLKSELEKMFNKKLLAPMRGKGGKVKSYTIKEVVEVGESYGWATYDVFNYQNGLYVRREPREKKCKLLPPEWYEVVPQKWLYDKSKDIAVMQKITLSLPIRYLGDEVSWQDYTLNEIYLNDIIQFETGRLVISKNKVSARELDVGDVVLFGDDELFFVKNIEFGKVHFENRLGERLELMVTSTREYTKFFFSN